jgi:hypothetical protein
MFLELIAVVVCPMLVSRVLTRRGPDAASSTVAVAVTPTAANVGNLARRRARFNHRNYTRGDGFTLSGPRLG